jgi:hypothetical protein
MAEYYVYSRIPIARMPNVILCHHTTSTNQTYALQATGIEFQVPVHRGFRLSVKNNLLILCHYRLFHKSQELFLRCDYDDSHKFIIFNIKYVFSNLENHSFILEGLRASQLNSHSNILQFMLLSFQVTHTSCTNTLP